MNAGGWLSLSGRVSRGGGLERLSAQLQIIL